MSNFPNCAGNLYHADNFNEKDNNLKIYTKNQNYTNIHPNVTQRKTTFANDLSCQIPDSNEKRTQDFDNNTEKLCCGSTKGDCDPSLSFELVDDNKVSSTDDISITSEEIENSDVKMDNCAANDKQTKNQNVTFEANGEEKISEEPQHDLFTSYNQEKKPSENLKDRKKRQSLLQYSMKLSQAVKNWDLDNSIKNIMVEDDNAVEEVAEDNSFLVQWRKSIAEFQSTYAGTSMEEYSFPILVKAIGLAAGRCLMALVYVFLNILPVFEVFLHIARFMLDKVINIKNTKEPQQVMVKTALFAVEIVCIYVCLLLIFGFVIAPIIIMAFGILKKLIFLDFF